MDGFISYSHRDEEYVERLRVHLANLERCGLIQTWYDRKIAAGSGLDSEISDAFDRSEVFLAVVSPDFIASEYCYERELARALERHAEGSMTVVPIIVEPCEWKKTPLSALKALPKDGKPVSDWANPNTAFVDIVNEVRRILESGLAVVSPVASADDRQGKQSVNATVSRYRPKREFDEIDKAQFRDVSFDEIVLHFRRFVDELNQVEGLRGHISIGSDSFEVAVVNRNVANGEAYLRLNKQGGTFGMFGDINFVTNRHAGHNSSNGGFRVSADDHDLFLSPTFLGLGATDRDRMSPNEVADHLWRELMERARITYA